MVSMFSGTPNYHLIDTVKAHVLKKKDIDVMLYPSTISCGYFLLWNWMAADWSPIESIPLKMPCHWSYYFLLQHEELTCTTAPWFLKRQLHNAHGNNFFKPGKSVFWLEREVYYWAARELFIFNCEIDYNFEPFWHFWMFL